MLHLILQSWFRWRMRDPGEFFKAIRGSVPRKSDLSKVCISMTNKNHSLHSLPIIEVNRQTSKAVFRLKKPDEWEKQHVAVLCWAEWVSEFKVFYFLIINNIIAFRLPFHFAEGKTLSVIREKKELSGSSTSLNSIGERKNCMLLCWWSIVKLSEFSNNYISTRA